MVSIKKDGSDPYSRYPVPARTQERRIAPAGRRVRADSDKRVRLAASASSSAAHILISNSLSQALMSMGGKIILFYSSHPHLAVHRKPCVPTHEPKPGPPHALHVGFKRILLVLTASLCVKVGPSESEHHQSHGNSRVKFGR